MRQIEINIAAEGTGGTAGSFGIVLSRAVHRQEVYSRMLARPLLSRLAPLAAPTVPRISLTSPARVGNITTGRRFCSDTVTAGISKGGAGGKGTAGKGGKASGPTGKGNANGGKSGKGGRGPGPKGGAQGKGRPSPDERHCGLWKHHRPQGPAPLPHRDGRRRQKSETSNQRPTQPHSLSVLGPRNRNSCG